MSRREGGSEVRTVGLVIVTVEAMLNGKPLREKEMGGRRGNGRRRGGKGRDRMIVWDE